MKPVLSFLAGCSLVLLSQSMSAGAASENDPVTIAALKAELGLLKTELETTRLDLSARLSSVELDTKSLNERATQLENGEPRHIPLTGR